MMTFFTALTLVVWICAIIIGMIQRSINKGIEEDKELSKKDKEAGKLVNGCLFGIPIILSSILALIYPLIAWKYDPFIWVSIGIGIWGAIRLLVSILIAKNYQRMVKNGELESAPAYKKARFEYKVYSASFLAYVVYILIMI